jgi:hypothetical protein
MKPLAASGCASRSRIMPSTVASSTSVPASMRGFGAQPERRALGHRLAQQVAGRDLRHAVGLDQQL